MKIGEVVNALETLAPKNLAESWDNPGLQVGDTEQECTGVLLSLDVSDSVIDEAVQRGANLVVSHHPLLFSPLKSLDIRSTTGKLLKKCLSHNVTVYCLHTNLDKAEGGMNDYAAGLLGLCRVSTLHPRISRDETYKLVTFVPPESREAVLKALFDAGGGRIGNYEGCSFSCPGEGTFFPGEDTSPVVGEKGVLNRVAESRIEVLFSPGDLQQGIAALETAHPYEVPAYDIYPLASVSSGTGFLRIGVFDPQLSWEEFLERVEKAFDGSDYRIVGKKISKVSRVALCTGSGASFIPQAAAVAEVFLTGDVKYHEAQKAQSLHLTVIEVGHFPMERIFVDLMISLLEKVGVFPRVKVYKSHFETDPFTFFHRGGNH